MKTKISAGGVVVYKRANTWYVVLIKDVKGMWTFPKGTIERGETPVSAAIREIREEVGVDDLMMIKSLGSVQYLFKRKEPIKKTVYFFLFQSKNMAKLKPQQDEGISQATWVPLDKTIDMIGYPKTNTSLLIQVRKLLAIKALPFVAKGKMNL